MCINMDSRRLITSTLQITVFANIRNYCDWMPFQAGNGLIDWSEIDDDFEGIYENIHTYNHGNVQL
jgi:hypothetical protein